MRPSFDFLPKNATSKVISFIMKTKYCNKQNQETTTETEEY